jgi:hypothetical protein
MKIWMTPENFVKFIVNCKRSFPLTRILAVLLLNFGLLNFCSSFRRIVRCAHLALEVVGPRDARLRIALEWRSSRRKGWGAENGVAPARYKVGDDWEEITMNRSVGLR